MLYFLLYQSNVCPSLTASDLDHILQVSRRNNERYGITGLLLYVEDMFVQLLEGEEQVVQQLYQTIEQDQRHAKSLVLAEDSLLQRNFPNWSMGLRSLSFEELHQKTGFRDLDANTFLKFQIRNSDHPALQLLKSFYEPEAADL
ncbi:BLUF domain-containing protein [Pontibacter chitinilyticus]|uniref:BLUF domain-containing protein n=1 Tax=Pontibacter chitinilyticus TaxID=2674989 RepID=UPI0032198E72